MVIKFLKPACGAPFNMAYFENDIAEVENKKAQLLIDEGFAESAEIEVETAELKEVKTAKKAVKK